MCTFFNRDKLGATHKKLLRLRRDHGFLGYGIYYRLLELMVYDDDHYLDNDPEMLRVALGIKAKAEREALEAVLYDYELFAFTEGGAEFFSPSLMHKQGGAEAISEDNLKNDPQILEHNLKNADVILTGNLKKRPYNLREEKRAILRENAKNARQSKKSNLKNEGDNLNDNLRNLNDNLKNDPSNLKETAPKRGGEYKGGDFSSLESIGLESIENNNISLQEKKKRK